MRPLFAGSRVRAHCGRIQFQYFWRKGYIIAVCVHGTGNSKENLCFKDQLYEKYSLNYIIVKVVRKVNIIWTWAKELWPQAIVWLSSITNID